MPHRHEVVVEGRAGHAGEVAMDARADALAAAAELVLALEQAARGAAAPTVATVGTLRVEPGAVSVIPGRAVLGLEVRGTDAAAIAQVEAALAAAERRAACAVRTYSGAGHDAQHLASRVPAALLFVPLAGGESHTPEEHATPEDVELAAAVLVDLLAAAGLERLD